VSDIRSGKLLVSTKCEFSRNNNNNRSQPLGDGAFNTPRYLATLRHGEFALAIFAALTSKFEITCSHSFISLQLGIYLQIDLFPIGKLRLAARAPLTLARAPLRSSPGLFQNR
jgi:hypothetical protein